MNDFFKTWSADMAYILGFWYADGNMREDRNVISFSQSKKDKYILKKIQEKIGYGGHLREYKNRSAYELWYCDKEIYNDIKNLGGKPAKSLDMIFPIVPKEYLPDFIRGYFDGDGCIMNLKGKRVNSAFTCASKLFREKLISLLREEGAVRKGSYDKSCYSYKFGKWDSISLGLYMYQHSSELYLKRKKDKFIFAIGESLKSNPTRVFSLTPSHGDNAILRDVETMTIIGQ